MKNILFCLRIISVGTLSVFISVLLFNTSCAGPVKKKIIRPNDIKPGSIINCVKVFERKMKDSGEHHKNVITIQGSVVKIELPDIYLKVAQVTSSNMIKEDSNWVQNQSVVKKPPYDIGETYAFRFKNNAIDNLVSTGLNQVYFESP